MWGRGEKAGRRAAALSTPKMKHQIYTDVSATFHPSCKISRWDHRTFFASTLYHHTPCIDHFPALEFQSERIQVLSQSL